MHFEGKTIYVEENLSPVLVPLLKSLEFRAERVLLRQADPYLAKRLAGGIILTADKDIAGPAGFHGRWSKAFPPVICVTTEGLAKRDNAPALVRKVYNLAMLVSANPARLSGPRPILYV